MTFDRSMTSSQKAPSTTRCIKTDTMEAVRPSEDTVRKHPAPQGALRPKKLLADWILTLVRKHPAPEGALRQIQGVRSWLFSFGQKAPSTRRYIKTHYSGDICLNSVGQKAPSTRRCIKTNSSTHTAAVCCEPGSTQHQKVH